MAIIASVIQYDDWEGEHPDVVLAKFVPETLATFDGSSGFGGTPVYDPIKAAKDFAESIPAVKIQIIDTQSPIGTSTHKREIYPQWLDENNFRTTWA